MDRKKLKAIIILKGTTQKELCKAIGMAESTFIRKCVAHGFKVDEVNRIVKVLNLTKKEMLEIFFPNFMSCEDADEFVTQG